MCITSLKEQLWLGLEFSDRRTPRSTYFCERMTVNNKLAGPQPAYDECDTCMCKKNTVYDRCWQNRDSCHAFWSELLIHAVAEYWFQGVSVIFIVWHTAEWKIFLLSQEVQIWLMSHNNDAFYAQREIKQVINNVTQVDLKDGNVSEFKMATKAELAVQMYFHVLISVPSSRRQAIIVVQ